MCVFSEEVFYYCEPQFSYLHGKAGNSSFFPLVRSIGGLHKARFVKVRRILTADVPWTLITSQALLQCPFVNEGPETLGGEALCSEWNSK